MRDQAAYIAGENFAEIHGFWIGDKPGNTKVLICNIPQITIRKFPDSMKIELLTLSDFNPFEVGGALWDDWHQRAEKEQIDKIKFQSESYMKK